MQAIVIDPANYADDAAVTAAVQAAINSASGANQSGAEIQICGAFTVTQTITIDQDSIAIVGVGHPALFRGGDYPIFEISATAPERRYNCYIRNFEIAEQWVSNGYDDSNESPAFFCNRISNCKFQDMRFMGFGGPFMRLENSWDSVFENLNSHWCGKTDHSGAALEVAGIDTAENLASSNNLWFDNLLIEEFRGAAISMIAEAGADAVSLIRFGTVKLEMVTTYIPALIMRNCGDIYMGDRMQFTIGGVVPAELQSSPVSIIEVKDCTNVQANCLNIWSGTDDDTLANPVGAIGPCVKLDGTGNKKNCAIGIDKVSIAGGWGDVHASSILGYSGQNDNVSRPLIFWDRPDYWTIPDVSGAPTTTVSAPFVQAFPYSSLTSGDMSGTGEFAKAVVTGSPTLTVPQGGTYLVNGTVEIGVGSSASWFSSQVAIQVTATGADLSYASVLETDVDQSIPFTNRVVTLSQGDVLRFVYGAYSGTGAAGPDWEVKNCNVTLTPVTPVTS